MSNSQSYTTLVKCPHCSAKIRLTYIYTEDSVEGELENWHAICERCGETITEDLLDKVKKK